MEKYTENYFKSDNKLYASELNSLISKINEIIQAINNGQSDPNNPENPEIPTNYTNIVRLTLAEFDALQTKQDGILYIVVDEDGNVLFMYLNGRYINIKGASQLSGTVNALTVTRSWWELHQDELDIDTIYVVTDDSGTMIVGIGVSKVLTLIPVPANGQVVRCSQNEYDTYIAAGTIDDGTLYCIETSGVITTVYLGTKKLDFTDGNGDIKSALTSMFSQNITWDGDIVKSIKWSMIDVDKPGVASLATGFEDMVLNSVKTAGFISKTDNTDNFAEMYALAVNADSTIAKKASILASINESNESNVRIQADKINLDGYLTASDADITYVKSADINTISAEIKSAIIDDLNTKTALILSAIINSLETGDITVKGTLNYNKLIGNVYTINDTDDIPSDATYVKINHPTSSTVIYSTLFPKNPVAGLTIYVESTVGNMIPMEGTALLAGLKYVGTVEIPTGNGSDTDTEYQYMWSLVTYDKYLKPYCSYVSYCNLSLALVHSYIYTGTQWVETTPIPNKIVLLTLAEKLRFGL